MLEAISEVTIGQLVSWGAAGTAVLTGVLEVAPIKIKPWSWLAKKIGRAINGEVIDKVDKLEKDIQEMRADEQEQRAKDARTRVLRFGDELIHDVHHSKEHFDDILQDISDYEKYCDEHPRFENDRMHLTAQLIKDTYRKCMEQHSFL